MTASNIITAYRAVQELNGLVLPYQAARDVARLKKALGEEFQVLVDRERAVVEKHGGKTKADGSYDFSSPEEAQACAAELAQRNREEADVDLPAADLSAFVADLRISPGAIEALEGLVIFEGGE